MLLAGSAEARRIAEALLARGITDVTALVSEPPRGAIPMPVPFELIPFDDCADLAARMNGFDAVIDASHGFDRQMTHVGFAAARRAGLPFVNLTRPRWDVAENPEWVSAGDLCTAMALVTPRARVFSAAGWASLGKCADFPGERLFLRQTSPHDRPAPYPFVELVFGRPPFNTASEKALFKELQIDTLLCRNLGGQPSRPKLDAAEALGLKVILIAPPEPPKEITICAQVSEILDWIDAL